MAVAKDPFALDARVSGSGGDAVVQGTPTITVSIVTKVSAKKCTKIKTCTCKGCTFKC
ncbi:hypothetical protein [Streptomyces coeruleorubidus]|uniref:hypothetical protein n=1 Tax=Streptomyces coeruleorubidus TaxID=116188 RepID=UPI00142F12A8|nr:hypothetical protein [Streptomyces coeruleorubidus]GGT67345.1 hypothetical protein GCM10010256_26630 [Streptomyces coeruleorubidus]